MCCRHCIFLVVGVVFPFVALLAWGTSNFEMCFVSHSISQGHAAKTLTAQQLHKKAERLAFFIQDKLKLNSGDHIALIYPAGLDLVCAFYACLYIGKLEGVLGVGVGVSEWVHMWVCMCGCVHVGVCGRVHVSIT